MDKQARKMQRKAEKEQAKRNKQGLKRSIINGPKNIMAKITGEVNKFDEMDDQRRKNYMTKPGFRKKWFRNLKLALLYGGAASAKLTLVPVVMMVRHFSKTKDRRMRNELVREIDTQIKVTDEKINDANAAGDAKEKYKLIRIKDQLQAERTRVATNSKYI